MAYRRSHARRTRVKRRKVGRPAGRKTTRSRPMKRRRRRRRRTY